MSDMVKNILVALAFLVLTFLAYRECEKVARVVENKEPIEDGAPIIYTERKDGVIPAYNIRTDKWDIALTAMDQVNWVS